MVEKVVEKVVGKVVVHHAPAASSRPLGANGRGAYVSAARGPLLGT